MHINKNALKIGSILLALCLLVAWLPVMVSALGASLTDGPRASAVSLSQISINGTTYYQIGTADDLYAFASLVNGGKNSINAILIADIVVNENVLNEDGSLNGTPSRTWTPIGKYGKPYGGIFDGNGHTISGLYCVKTGSYTGLFGYVLNGTVKNVGVMDSYFKGEGSTAGVLGYNANGTVQNCYNGATVIGNGTYVGGVVGNNGGLVTNCYNTGIISGTSEVGGITGRNTGTVIGCYHSGSVTATSYYTGAVVGNHCSGTVQNCYYLPGSAINGKNILQNGIGNSKSDGTTADCAGMTTSMTAEQFASGEVAWLLQSAVTDQDASGNILQIWGQNIGIDPSPTLSEYVVYRNSVTVCGESTYRYANAPADPINTHDYQVVTTAPTCTETGVKTYSCACGESYSEVIAATGHNYENGICTICSATQPVDLFEISKTNMIMGQNLSLLFAFEKSNIKEADLSDYEAHVAIAYKDKRGTMFSQITAVHWTPVQIDGIDYWCVTVSNLAAKEMDDDVTVVIYKSGVAVSTPKTMSLRQYGEERLAASTDPAFKTVVVDMLNYGAEAQKYFNYNVDNLANRNLTDQQKSLATTNVNLDKIRHITFDPNNHFIASSVQFKSDIVMVFAISRSSGAVTGKITFINHKNEIITVVADTYTDIIVDGKEAHMYAFAGMVVADLDQVLTIEFYDAEGNLAIALQDSLDAYLGRVSITSTMYALADAFGKFSTSAYAYLH